MRIAINAVVSASVLLVTLTASSPAAAQPAAAQNLATNQTEFLNFSWRPTPGATHYYVWINDAASVIRWRRWYTAAEANCGTGQTAICDVNIATHINPGRGTWWIQTWNSSGYGPWSAGQTFSAHGDVSQQRTRLLLPFATNQAGFDTGVSVANTGRDSSGIVGRAGTCSLHYFGRLANGNPAIRTETSTTIQAGDTMTFTLSTGGGYGVQGYAGFQGYIEFNCNFPFAHGFGFMTDGPIGTARVGSTVPMLVLPSVRNSSKVESAGQ